MQRWPRFCVNRHRALPTASRREILISQAGRCWHLNVRGSDPAGYVGFLDRFDGNRNSKDVDEEEPLPETRSPPQPRKIEHHTSVDGSGFGGMSQFSSRQPTAPAIWDSQEDRNAHQMAALGGMFGGNCLPHNERVRLATATPSQLHDSVESIAN